MTNNKEDLGVILQIQVALATIGTALLQAGPARIEQYLPFMPAFVVLFCFLAMYGSLVTILELADWSWTKVLYPSTPIGILSYLLALLFVIQALSVMTQWAIFLAVS